MRTLDLGYWDGEKECQTCGQIAHYTADCPRRNARLRSWKAIKDETPIEKIIPALREYTIQGRHSYEAWTKACLIISRLNRKWYDENWSKIEVEEV